MKKKNKNLTHSSSTYDEKTFDLYKKRLNNSNLIWCNQVLDLVKNYNINSIKDIGCNYFQFYKEMKLRKWNVNYFGYDIDKKFINLGLTKFPELNKKYKIGNCEKIKLNKTDCSVISATLEHATQPKKLLDNILNSTKKIVIVRTYLGKKSHKLISKPNLRQIRPYNVNQFSFNEIEDQLKKYKFNTIFILDKATNNSEKFKLFNNKFKRFIYIVLGIRK